MIVRIPGFVGAALGAIAALLVIGSASRFRQSAPVAGPMLGEHGGAIRSVVMQYTKGSSLVWPTYRQFLQYQPASVTVYMVCPGAEDFSEIHRQLSDVKCPFVPVYTGHEITTWARDRWVALSPLARGDAITLLAPKGELQEEIWPARAGDSHVAEDLARALGPAVRARRSALYFDGGDILADGRFAFVTAAVLRRNLQHTVTERQELIERLQHDLGREVVLMDDAPDHHAGMYMMAVGDGRMLVGDPSLGLPLLAGDSPSLAAMEGGPDFSPQTQARFDAVAKLAAEHGYRVIRIPTVPARDGKRYLTYVNVIMDVRDGRPIVYMPIYEDQPRLNAAAQAVWESLGYQVLPVDCTSVWPQGGTLHCLVNVMERELLG
jgi:agmatine/peptidylarginine deiminase